MGHTLVRGSPQGYRGPGIVANSWELVTHLPRCAVQRRAHGI